MKTPFFKILLFIIALLVSLCCCDIPVDIDDVSDSIDSVLSELENVLSPEVGDDESEEPKQEEPKQEEPKPTVNSTFEVHFIDVGQADAALILCDGKAMLIDGGNKGDSNVMYNYLKKLNVSYIDYVIATHAHEDHIGGLAGALNYATAGKVYCPVTSYDSEAFNDFVKYATKGGAEITVPKTGDNFTLGSASVKILACNVGSDTNNTSIVLKITYGETTFLFTGDAEREVEEYILNSGVNLATTVLKVGHHGSETSSSYRFIYETMPQYAVISVGDGNSYGHPEDVVLSRLGDADVKVFRTDLQGDIICKSDGKSVTFTVSRNENADTLKPQSNVSSSPEVQPSEGDGESFDYVMNTKSKKFHYASCSSVEDISPENTAYHSGSRDELVSMGYDPCGRCKP